MPKHIKAFVGSAGVTLVLALVILGGAMFAPQKSANPDLVKQNIEQAVDSLSKGDTDTAKILVDEALKADPDNKDALALRLEIEKLITDKTNSDSTNTDTNTDGDSNTDDGNGEAVTGQAALDKKYAQKIADPAAVFPETFSGFMLADPVAEASAYTMSATPDVKGKVATISWAIVDQATPVTAASYVKNMKDNVYPNNPGTVSVSGVDAVLGTNTNGPLSWAAVTFSAGRYSLQVLVTGKSNAKEADLIETAKLAALAFQL